MYARVIIGRMKTELKPVITAEEPALMKKLAGSGKPGSKFALRLLVIINRAAGKTLERISEFPAVSLSPVIRYIKQFNAKVWNPS
jgi:hypothetical protein